VILLKVCIKCGVEKPTSNFYKHATSRDGLRSDCKDCHKANSTANYLRDLEKSKQDRREYYKRRISQDPDFQKKAYWADLEKKRKEGRDAYAKHREKRLEAVKEYARKNRGKSNAAKKRYKLAKSRAVPPWVNVCFGARIKIENIYRRAQELTDSTGTPHHVDHIIPLRGKTVSGLHVPSNLQILTADENMRKSNRVITE
jgi:hypothetical protein